MMWRCCKCSQQNEDNVRFCKRCNKEFDLFDDPVDLPEAESVKW